MVDPADRARQLVSEVEEFDGFGLVVTAGENVEVVLGAEDGEAGLRTQLKCVSIYLDTLSNQLEDDIDPEDVAKDALAMLDEQEFVGFSRGPGSGSRR